MSSLLICSVLSFTLAASSLAADLTSHEAGWLAKAKRFERHGWIYLHLEGEPAAHKFQHGYLLAPEIAEN